MKSLIGEQLDQFRNDLEVYSASDEKSIQDYIQTARAVVAVDLSTHRIIYISRPAELMFGYHMRNELRGEPLNRLLPDTFHKVHTTHLEDYNATPHSRPMGQTDMKLIGKRRDGREFPLEIHLESITLRGKRIGIAIVSAMDKKPHTNGK